MKITSLLTMCSVAILTSAGGSAIAQSLEESPTIGGTIGGLLDEVVSGSIVGAKIEDLRARSTTTFERLDENQSGSITLDEIDLSESEEDTAKLSRFELRAWRHRSMLIERKFLRYDEETEEFEIVDKNDDGVLNKEEYDLRHETIRSRGVEFGWNKMDTDGNGGVELLEFNSFLDDLEQIDEDGDGTISSKEAKKSGESTILPELMMPSLYSFDMIDELSERVNSSKEAVDDKP